MSCTIRYQIVRPAFLLAAGLLFFFAAVTIHQIVRADPGVFYAAATAQGSEDCASWADACTLQTALSGASSDDEIWVMAGVHYPGSMITDTFTLQNGVALYGGFAGTETSRDQRDWATNITVLSGDIDQNDLADPNGVITTTAHITGTNAYHVVTSSGVTETAVLDGFVITAGQANGDAPDNDGGGMYNGESSPTLTNISFSGNSAGYQGGGMFNRESNPMLANVTFSGNLAQYGGGMFNYINSSPMLTSATFSGNSSTAWGGGMHNYFSSPMLTNATFSGNSASTGGGMFNTSSSPTLTNVTFSGNTASSNGGGIFNIFNCNLTLTNVTFSDNSTANSGGGMYNSNSSSPTLTNVTFSGNQAGYSGGGMHNNNSSSPMLTNASFSGNTAGTYGGGMSNYASSSPTLTNAILWGNSAPNGADIYNDTSTPQISFSDIQGCGGSGSWDSACGADGGDNIEADPLFVDAANGNLRLQDTSPAINAGDNAALPPGILTDLDGAPRFVGVVVDLGAYENQTFACPAGGVLYVDQSAAGDQTGESWVNALITLQDALQVSEACEIWVAEGMYYPDQGGSQADNDRAAAFALKNGVALYGGFAGTETTREERNWLVNVTVLSGDIDQNDLTDPTGVVTNTANIIGTNSYHVVTSSSVTETAVLDGFVITAGQANGAEPNYSGGGMYNVSGSPTLMNITFSGNLANYRGGGMYNNSSSPTLTNVTFSGNTAGQGGGMNNRYSSPTLMHVTFSGNTADDGGGMNNEFSNPPLTNITFSSNQANYGGGMVNSTSNPTLTNVTFNGNSAMEYGGGMWNYESSPTLTNVTFSGNSAIQVGGGVYNATSNPTLTNVILWGSSATNGAGIYNATSTPQISFSDIQDCGGSGVSWDSACGTDGGGNIEADPLFVDAASGDLRLQLTSPAIDAGNNAALPPDILTDLDGSPRFVDLPTVPDTGSGTAPIVDMGAYEVQYVDVVLGKAVLPAAAAPGEPITFTLALTNTGSLPATGIVVADSLPAWLWDVSFTSTLSVTDTGNLPPYAWQVQDLAPGQAGLITISGVLSVPLAAGTYTNTALISAAGDLLAENNTAIITFSVPNLAPVFTSAPLLTAIAAAPYTYLATTQDDNGDALTLTAPALPAWLTLTDHGDGTATLSGTPTNADVGEHTVTLRVTDSSGLTDTQTFTITVWSRVYLPLVLRNMP